jgi:hypothetical protein
MANKPVSILSNGDKFLVGFMDPNKSYEIGDPYTYYGKKDYYDKHPPNWRKYAGQAMSAAYLCHCKRSYKLFILATKNFEQKV